MSVLSRTVASEMISDERILLFQDQQESHVRRVSSKGGDRVSTITNLYFKNKHLSKQHATVRYDKNEGFTVEDTNSTFGTIINDAVIKHNIRQPLKDKDTLGFILSKPSLKIREVFKKFETDLEHKNIPLSEFDLPKISMKFDVAINKSVLKLVPCTTTEASHDYELTNEGSVTNLSAFESTEFGNNDVDEIDKGEYHANDTTQDEKKSSFTVIDLDEDHEENMDGFLGKKSAVEPSIIIEELPPKEPVEINSKNDETVGIQLAGSAQDESGLDFVELEDGLVLGSIIDEKKTNLQNHSDDVGSTSQPPTPRENDLDHADISRNNVEADKDDDEPPSESEIVYEVYEMESDYNSKEIYDEEDAEVNVGDKVLDTKEVNSENRIVLSDSNLSNIGNCPETCHLEEPLRKNSSPAENSDEKYNSDGIRGKLDYDYVTDYECEHNCSDAEDYEFSCDCHREEDQTASDYSYLSSDWDGDEHGHSLEIFFEGPSLEDESVCVCSDPEDCYCGKKQMLRPRKKGVDHNDSDNHSYECLGCHDCDSHISNSWDILDSDEDSVCVCSDPEVLYCEKGHSSFIPPKQREDTEMLESVVQFGFPKTAPHDNITQSMVRSDVDLDSPEVNNPVVALRVENTRKRSYQDTVEGEEFDDGIDNEGDVEMPPRKKQISEDSKLKTIFKEVVKGLFYVAATITALGIYGSTLEEN